MRTIAIIPARGGSKRIPRKNIKLFLGKPAIAYSIETAINSRLFDEVMVSTDDNEISRVAIEYGANVPFLRSVTNSNDFTGTGDVCAEVLDAYHKAGKDFDVACCIYATAPLIKAGRLKESLALLLNGGFDATFPVGRFSSPILRSFKVDDKSHVTLNFPQFETKRSQDLPPAYFDAGQFYWFYASNLARLPNKNSFGLNKGAIVLDDHEVQDIDELNDWVIAELKYRYTEQATIHAAVQPI